SRARWPASHRSISRRVRQRAGTSNASAAPSPGMRRSKDSGLDVGVALRLQVGELGHAARHDVLVLDEVQVLCDVDVTTHHGVVADLELHALPPQAID